MAYFTDIFHCISIRSGVQYAGAKMVRNYSLLYKHGKLGHSGLDPESSGSGFPLEPAPESFKQGRE
jgi:hypothetical protein